MNKNYIFGILLLFISAFINEVNSQESISLNRNIRLENIAIERFDDKMVISMRVIFDELKMKSNQSIVLTPFIKGYQGSLELAQSIMINGRRQHISYLRNNQKGGYKNCLETLRINDSNQSIEYTSTLIYQPWMDNCALSILEDLCGCGLSDDLNSRQLAVFHFNSKATEKE